MSDPRHGSATATSDHGALGTESPRRRSGSSSCAGATARGPSWPRPCSATTAATGFDVYSAGIEPEGRQPADDPRRSRRPGSTDAGLRSKSVDEFLGQRFDYVITVCDEARDVCPVFPGVHESLHWGYEDPAKVEGTEEQRLAAFRSVFTQLGQRIHQFLPIAERFAAERRPVELA